MKEDAVFLDEELQRIALHPPTGVWMNCSCR